MNKTLRTFVAAVAGCATVGAVLVTVATPASAVGARYTGTPVGTVSIRPATGTNQSAIDYTTSAACPAGVSYEARLFGAGMPDAGEVVTSRTDAGFSTSSPVSGSFSNTPQFFADKNSATLSGTYDVVVRCTDRFGDTSRGDFRGTITFSSPTAYTASGASPSPSASASATAGPTGAPSECTTPASLALSPSTIIATGAGTVTVRATPGSIVRLFAYSRPSTTYRAVREATLGSSGSTSFEVKPPTNTRLYAQQVGCDPSDSAVLNVRTQLSLNVVRNGTRNYTFSGRALPARTGGLIVSLYRVTDSGQQILASQVRANASTGAYSINRVFTGSGRFGFVVRTGQDLQNAPGASNVRSLLVF